MKSRVVHGWTGTTLAQPSREVQARSYAVTLPSVRLAERWERWLPSELESEVRLVPMEMTYRAGTTGNDSIERQGIWDTSRHTSAPRADWLVDGLCPSVAIQRARCRVNDMWRTTIGERVDHASWYCLEKVRRRYEVWDEMKEEEGRWDEKTEGEWKDIKVVRGPCYEGSRSGRRGKAMTPRFLESFRDLFWVRAYVTNSPLRCITTKHNTTPANTAAFTYQVRYECGGRRKAGIPCVQRR